MSFGERLTAARKEQNMTVKALAEACWTSTTAIHHYEKGRRLPTAEMLIRLCNALKVSPTVLLQELTPEKRAELSAFLTLLQEALEDSKSE